MVSKSIRQYRTIRIIFVNSHVRCQYPQVFLKINKSPW